MESAERKDDFKPCGYYVLVEMDELEAVNEEFIDGGTILAPAQAQKKTLREHEWDQQGKDTGTLLAIGPTAYCEVAGIDNRFKKKDARGEYYKCSNIDRAAQWGVAVGDRVMFNKNNGKLINDDKDDRRRLLTDVHLIGGLS